jgi:DNA polymerase-3 subunit beta
MNAPAIALATSIVTTLTATLDRRALASALSRLKHALDRCAALPALGAVLIENIPGALLLTVTDAHVFVRVSIAATVTDAGSLLVPLRRLSEIAKGPAMRLQLAGDTVTVGGVTHRLTTMPPESFPEVPPPSGTVLFTLLRPTLARLLRQTSYAMSSDITRPHLAALLVQRRADELVLVATDGHRLSVARVADAGRDFSVLVGRRTIEEVERLVNDFGGLVRLQREGDRMWFVAGDEFVSGPVVDAVFPSYGQVIPESFTGRITFTRVELVEAIRALAPKGSNGVTLALQRDAGQVVLRVDDGDGNAAETQVAATFAGEPPAGIGFNGQFLREMLGGLGDEDRTVTFEVNGEVDPVRVDGAAGVTAVVMPMRV